MSMYCCLYQDNDLKRIIISIVNIRDFVKLNMLLKRQAYSGVTFSQVDDHIAIVHLDRTIE